MSSLKHNVLLTGAAREARSEEKKERGGKKHLEFKIYTTVSIKETGAEKTPSRN